MTTEYMTTPLENPDDGRSVQGMFQSDVIIRTAIIAAFQDLRENPQLLDYVFASLPKDPLTFRQYGKQQVAAAKDWFLKTDVPVRMNTILDEDKVPCITIGLSTSAESSSVLGDIHYETAETDLNEDVIVYGGPHIPSRYIAETGVVIMRSSFDLNLFPGMVLRDSNGGLHPIVDVYDATTFSIEPGANVQLANCYFQSAPGRRTVTLETVEFREVYEIGCHAFEPTHLAWLSSILGFVLFRYKEELLEARGLARTSVSLGPVALNTSFQVSQPVFTRMFTLTGFVFHTWPKHFSGPIIGMEPYFDEINEDDSTDPIFDSVDVDLSDLDPNYVVDGNVDPINAGPLPVVV